MQLRNSALHSDLWFMKSLKGLALFLLCRNSQNFEMSIKIYESSLLAFVQLDRH